MGKYIYAEASTDFWPRIKTIIAQSYDAAVEKIIREYITEFDIKQEFDDFESLRDYLNEYHSIDLSYLEDIEEL